MDYESWELLLGDNQTREWNGCQYNMRISADDQEEMRIIGSLQSNTPVKNFIEKATDDILIRSLSFLSYYNINPTFNNENDDIGTGFFWFPLDHLTDEMHELISQRLENEEDENEESDEDEDEDAPLPDFPIMSTVSRPVIDAATSESYLSNVDRISEESRRERLQEEIKERQQEQVNQFEEWLEEGMSEESYPRNLSMFSDVVGKLPAVILLNLVKEERERINNIYQVFENIQTWKEFDIDNGPSFLLEKLNRLAGDYPVFKNPAIEAFCLDETSRGCEYHVTKSRGYMIDGSIETCESCSSDLFRVYRTGLDEEVKDAWMMGLLPELVVARLLQKADWTQEVLPHRRVQMLQDDGDMTSAVEVDVCVQTQNDEAVFFEVTSQREALNRLNNKKQKFEQNNIKYDALVQVAPGHHEEMISFSDSVVSVGGWMVRGLETVGFKDSLKQELSSVSLE
jgi:hypothetical protein